MEIEELGRVEAFEKVEEDFSNLLISLKTIELT